MMRFGFFCVHPRKLWLCILFYLQVEGNNIDIGLFFTSSYSIRNLIEPKEFMPTRF